MPDAQCPVPAALSFPYHPPMPPTGDSPPSVLDCADRFRRTRRAHRDETREDYVEAIAQLSDAAPDSAAGARVKDLAHMMGVSHVTVVRIISRLSTQGLVRTSRGRPVQLTPAGRELAERARERHQIVLRFLLALGVPETQAQLDAEGIEHHVSHATITAMKRTLAQRPASPEPAR